MGGVFSSCDLSAQVGGGYGRRNIGKKHSRAHIFQDSLLVVVV